MSTIIGQIIGIIGTIICIGLAVYANRLPKYHEHGWKLDDVLKLKGNAKCSCGKTLEQVCEESGKPLPKPKSPTT